MLRATVRLAKQEMQNRMSGFDTQIQMLTPNLSGKGDKPNAAGTGTTAPTASAPAAAAAPAAKVMPDAATLKEYAATHFGGDIDTATAFLKKQGYQ
jgi:hypothetical protein